MMPTTASRDDWAGPLAALVASIRRDWDYPGVRAAISKARHRGTPLEVARALLKLAENTALRTPAMLADDGSHWGTVTSVLGPRSPRCTVEGHEFELAHNCPRCKWDAAVEADLAAREAGLIPDASLSAAQLERNAHGARTVLDAAPLDVRRLAAGEKED